MPIVQSVPPIFTDPYGTMEELLEPFWVAGLLVLKLMFTAFGVMAFAISTKMINVDINHITQLLIPLTAQEQEILKREEELAGLNSELDTMSEMDEFAKYHRKRRVILKLQDELDALSGKQRPAAMMKSLRINIGFHILIGVSVFVFSYFSRDIVIARIPETVFWPFNFLLTMPWIFGGTENGEVLVSLFNWLLLVPIVFRAWERQYLQKILKKTN